MKPIPCRAEREVDGETEECLYDKGHTGDHSWFRRFRRERMTRQEKLQGMADRGCDTWEEYRGER